MYLSLPSINAARRFLAQSQTTRFGSYLDGAIFLLRAITERSPIGIDANTIKTGDELTQSAVDQ